MRGMQVAEDNVLRGQTRGEIRDNGWADRRGESVVQGAKGLGGDPDLTQGLQIHRGCGIKVQLRDVGCLREGSCGAAGDEPAVVYAGTGR